MWPTLLYVAGGLSVVVLLLHVLYYYLRVDFNTPKEQTMTELEPQSLPRFYFCAVIQALHLSAGKFYPVLPGEKLTKSDPDSPAKFFPPRSERMLATECYMRHDKLRLYRKCIGYSCDPKKLPPIFMSGYFNKALIAVGSSQFSRMRILGVVHLREQVTVYQDITRLIRENFQATLLCEEYKETPRGIESTLRASIYDLNDILVWEALMTGLTIRPGSKPVQKKPQSKPVEFPVHKQEEIDAPASTGLDFAHATQDWQPQHLNKWTSKLVGFSSPIAHGLWSMAVAVDRVMASETESFEDRYPLHVDVSFKRPLVLPGKALLQFDKPKGPSSVTNFRMEDTKSHAPILVGHMSVGEKREN